MEVNIIGIHLQVYLTVTCQQHSNLIPRTYVPPLQPVHWLFSSLNSEYVTAAFQLAFKEQQRWHCSVSAGFLLITECCLELLYMKSVLKKLVL